MSQDATQSGTQPLTQSALSMTQPSQPLTSSELSQVGGIGQEGGGREIRREVGGDGKEGERREREEW